MSSKFLARCRDELPTLRALAAKGTLAAEAVDREVLLKTAHSLAGAGGTFGFPGLSERASRVENLLVAGADVNTAEIHIAVDELIEEMERMLA